MTTEKLYDIIKSWSVRIHDEGFLMMENEMLDVLKSLESDMLIEQSKKRTILRKWLIICLMRN